MYRVQQKINVSRQLLPQVRTSLNQTTVDCYKVPYCVAENTSNNLATNHRIVSTDKSMYRVKGGPYSIAERRVPELIPVLGSQRLPAGDVSHKPDGRLPLLSARPAVTPATLTTAATNVAAW